MKKVAVIIPMYNHAAMTHECIKACRENAGIPIDIVVIDDGSKEPFYSADAKIIRLNHNSGFTKAVNSGLRALSLQYDYVCILNNDTIPQKDFLKIMVEDCESDETIGIVGASRITDDKDFAMQTHGAELLSGKVYAVRERDLAEKLQAIFIPFCCVLLTKKLVEDIGLLDERMKNHCSDNDYCLRAVLNGFGVVSDTEARVIHYQSVTVKEHNLDPNPDKDVFIAKHFGVMLNEVLRVIPIMFDRYGEMGFRYVEPKKEEKPMIEVVRS